MAESDGAIHRSFLVYFPQMVHPSFYWCWFCWHFGCFCYFLEIKITRFDFLLFFSYKLWFLCVCVRVVVFFFSGLSNTFTGKSNHHCHVSAYEKSFPIKSVPSPSWSGSCRRNLLSPKKMQRRHVSTAEEVRKTCNKGC